MSTSTASTRLRTRDLTHIALFAVLMAVCAWITIPMTVPFTLQIFAVFAALATLGGRRGTYAVAVYLLLGAVGLPVGAGFQGGLGWLLGTTGGYIVGFLCIALIYWLMTAKLGESLPVSIAACVLGLAVCYVFGTIWFMVVYARTTGPVGVMTALGWCVFPYVIPDLLKLVLAVTLSQRVKGFLR